MAAPGTTVRQTPAGIRLDYGDRTKIAFERDPDVSFWEKSITPPGIDGGDGIEDTTMFNDALETQVPGVLKKYTDGKITVAYDPAVYTQIDALVNRNGAITIRFPDGTTLSFWGWLAKFEPGELKRREQPEADITIFVSNRDLSGNEVGPVLTSVSGT